MHQDYIKKKETTPTFSKAGPQLGFNWKNVHCYIELAISVQQPAEDRPCNNFFAATGGQPLM